MARAFDQTPKYGTNANGIVTAAPFSMSAWCRPTGTTADRYIVTVGDTASDNENMGLYMIATTNKIRAFSRSGGSSSEAESSAGASSGSWAHAGGVWSAANSRAAYLDGANKGTNAVSVTPTSIDTCRVGILARSSITSTLCFVGDLAEVAIWSAALDDAEMAALGKGFCPQLIRPQSLVAYWPILGNLSPEQDRWVSKFDLTLTGSPAKADHTRMFYPTGAF